MNAREANVLLTAAAQFDGRLRLSDSTALAERAKAWARLLDDVNLSDALAALQEHYRNSTEVFMPAHVLARVSHLPSAEMEQLEAWLAERGLTIDQARRLSVEERERLVGGALDA